jgi:Fur family ferric uptake transcriptional regulator
VYRQLERLVDEGVINKYTIDKNSSACFEYIGQQGHGEGTVCFHCKCEKCGKVIHLQCEEIVELQEHMQREHHFLIDPIRTVYYGICEDCAGRTGK